MRKEYDFSKGKRGPVVPPPPGKTRVFLWIDDELLESMRRKLDEQGGGDYSDIVNRALDLHLRASQSELAETLRQVIREELHKSPRRKTASR